MRSKDKQAAICNEVIRMLQQERERQNLSRYAVAARSGLAEQTIGYVERGLRRPSFETILKIADGIGVELSEVLQRANKRLKS